MEQKHLLHKDATIGKYTIVEKLSIHHDGEREVYTACEKVTRTGVESESVERRLVLTVFNLETKRYMSDGMERKRVPDFIEEVSFLHSRGEKSVGFAKVLDSGITKVGKKKLGWIAQEYCTGEPLSEVLSHENVLSLANALKVMNVLTGAVGEIMQFTRGGGHYGISIDNILVDIDRDDNVQNVKLVGLSNIGASYHGSVPFSNEGCDNRFRAPETLNGVFSHQTDIYSLGIVMTMMVCGVLESEYSLEGFDKNDPFKYRNIFMDKARKYLSGSLRLILNKATDINTIGRFQTVDKFQYFLDKLSVGQISTQTHLERTETSSARSKKREDETGAERFARLDRDAVQKAHGKTCHGDKSMAESRSKLRGGDVDGHGLDDVAGMDELKAKFRRNFVQILRYPRIAKAYGITPCNCTLLYGPQGCGKTYIAEKAAQESGLKYKIVNPSDLGSIYIHGAQEKIAETFREAEKNAPIILIFDEFDAIAPKRDGDLNPNQANEVNELLTRLNNCAEKGVYILATTNRPELVDSAILRTGRVDEMYYVSLPDFKARHDIFQMELEKRPCGNDIDLDALAQATENYTCSDLSYIIKESARRCFDETIEQGEDTPIPLSQSKILEVIKNTRSSVSPTELKSYMEMKERIERRNDGKYRPRVGFFTN